MLFSPHVLQLVADRLEKSSLETSVAALARH
jgi:hypothetical protein